jgi:hypothetical protein
VTTVELRNESYVTGRITEVTTNLTSYAGGQRCRPLLIVTYGCNEHYSIEQGILKGEVSLYY